MSDARTPEARPKNQAAAGPAAVDKTKAADKAQASQEAAAETVTEEGGFDNDPDDATNPNEAIERHRRKVRPSQ